MLLKLLVTGHLQRIPKNPAHRDLVLALVCGRLRRHYPYSEPELNGEIAERLQLFKAHVDHVTCRRFLVDCGFVKRDRAGSRYYLNFPKLEATLEATLLEQAETLIESAYPPPRKKRPTASS